MIPVEVVENLMKESKGNPVVLTALINYEFYPIIKAFAIAWAAAQYGEKFEEYDPEFDYESKIRKMIELLDIEIGHIDDVGNEE